MDNILSRPAGPGVFHKTVRILLWTVGLILLFSLYTWGISKNPPGFHMDESATAFNAYLVSRTGAGESGPKFPVLFQEYAVANPTYINPLAVYLLAIVFRFVPPSIPVARTFAAFWMFAACLLLGVLATRISGQRKIGIIVAGTALVTPWFFELGRLVFDAHFSAFMVVVFLLATYRLQSRDTWNWRDIAMVAGAFAVVSYGYFGGRVLAPLFALGLLFFATTKQRLFGVLELWLACAVTLLPLILFSQSHAGVLTKRLWEVTYIRPGAPWSEIPSQLAEFIRCYLQDQSLIPLLMRGDVHWPHHVEGSGGAMLFATFILAMAGLLLVLARRWRDAWWRFVLYGLAVSIVPGAIADWPFHQPRLMGYAVFLLILTIPALEWLLSPPDPRAGLPRGVRIAILAFLLASTIAQAVYFQSVFWRKGLERNFAFDVLYKDGYDAAVARSERPIYLEDGQWGPAYIHAYWYATVEGRPLSQFVHLRGGATPPPGAIVLSSYSDCHNCVVIKKYLQFELYKTR